MPGFFSGFTDGKNVNGPWLARGAVRELKLHGTDWAKIYTTQDFVGGDLDEFRPDGSLVAIPSLTLEEVQAIVDEAHRMGLKVACHTYGGEGMRSCVQAGVDLPMHMLELYRDDETMKLVLQKRLPVMMTIDDLHGARGRRPQADGRQDQPAGDGRAVVQEAARGRRAVAVRQRRRAGRVSARQAGRSVPVPREMGHDARAGAAEYASWSPRRC